MDEKEWLECTDIDRVLGRIIGVTSGSDSNYSPNWRSDVTIDIEPSRIMVSARKLRLFAVGSCRCVWERIQGEASRCAVEATERYVDGLANAHELETAWSGAHSEETCFAPARDTAFMAKASNPLFAAAWCAWNSIDGHISYSAREKTALLSIARDIFGNPFRSVAVDPAWLGWNSGTIRKLAKAIYEERRLPKGSLDNVLLSVLGDALQEAGCTSEEILTHCRQFGEHVRGCWLVDAVLAKDAPGASTH